MADNLTDQTPVDNTENPSSAPVQADPPSAKKKLYDKLVKDKLYSKSFDDFDKQFSTMDKVSKLHDFLAKKEQYTKGADMFSAQYFPDVQDKAAAKAAPVAQAVPSTQAAPAVPEQPVKKKDHSEPVAVPGSPISGTQLPPFQTEVNPANTPVVAPNSPLLDAQAVAAQAANEHQVKQQQDAVKNPVSSLINDYNTGNVANEHNLGSASLSTNPILQSLQKDAVTKDQYDKAGGNLLYDPEAQQKADAWEKAHPGQKMPSQTSDQGTISKGHIPTFADKFKNNVIAFDAGVIKGVGDLKATAGDLETMTDKVLAKAGLMDKGTSANFQQNTDNSQAQFNKDANLGYAESYLDNNPVTGIGRMVPMLMGGGSHGAKIAALQAWGSAAETVDKLKSQGVKFENGSDLLYKGGSALINYFLMKDVIGTTLLKSMGQETFNGFVGAAAADATKELAEKGVDATAQDYANYYMVKAGQLAERAGAWGVGAVKTYAKVGADFAIANLAGTGLKATVNAMNKVRPLPAVTGDEVANDVSSPFYNGDTPAKGSLSQFVKNLVTSPAAAFSALHAAQSAGMLFNNSPYVNPVISDLQKDQSPENIQRIKDQLGKYGESNGWTPDEIQQTHAKVDELADIATKIPNTIEPAKFNKAVNLIMDRRHMEGVLEAAQARKSGLDPALQGAASKFENWLGAQVDQANDRLNYLVTDKPWTYFEHQGEYFKVQQDSEPVKIAKDRYDLEGVNNKRESLSDGSIVMEPGEADKKGNPIPEKDGEKENKSAPAKAAVPEEPAKPEPAKAEKPTPAPAGGSGDKVEKENAKPERPEAVTPNKQSDGNEEVKTETEKGIGQENGRQDVLTPEKTGDKENAPVFSNEEEADRHWIQHETDPEAIASYYHQQNFNAENVADYKEHRINEYLGNTKINADDFSRFGDDNLLQGDRALSRRIDKTNSQLPIDTQAQELSDDHLEVNPQDIVDFITKYKNPEDFKERAKTQIQKDLADKYAELTGTSLTGKRAEDAYNKQQEIHKQARLSDDAREIIDREGITPANIDKLESMFRGFPYSEEDFDNVKRYLDEHAKTEKPKSGATTASPGAKSAGVGETEQKPTAEPKQRKEPAKPGELTPEQQKVADEVNRKIESVQAQLDRERANLEKKLAEISERNNLFGKEDIGQKVTQTTAFDVPLNTDPETVNAALSRIRGNIDGLEVQIADLKKMRDTAIKSVHQQTNAFESPTDDGQVTAAKNSVKAATDLVAKRNAHPDGGGSEGVKKIKSVLGDKDKKAVDDIRKRIREKLNGPDPMTDMSYSEDDEDELFTDGIKLTKLYFKAGIRAFPEFAGIMIEDMGESVVPFLKSFYEGAKNLPGMVSSEYDSTDTVDYHIAKLNEVSDPVETFIDRVKAEINAGSKLNITHLEGMASEAGLATDVRTHLQEYVERALIELAREAMDNPLYDDREKFNELVDLYNKQPALHQRSSTKVLLQQYSTPLPYAYSAGLYVDGIKPGRVYDPTAGTGNLLIAFDPSKAVTNEIDPLRVKILQQLGYSPINFDAADDVPINFVDGVVANPPFGPTENTYKTHDYKFNKLDYIIPLKALMNMKSGGRASVIIGGHNEYDAKGGLKGGDFQFLNYLHHYYNVTDVINVDGNLYAKQGTTFPTRLILINGRKEVPQSYAPAYDAERDKPVKTFEDLFNRIQERIKQDENPTVLQSRVDVQPDFGRNNDGDGAGQVPAKDTGRSGTVSGTTPDEPNRRSVEGEGTGRAGVGGQTQPGNQLDLAIGDSEGDHTGGELAVVPDEVAKYAEAAEAGSIGPEGAGELVPRDRPVSVNRPSADELVNNEKVPYTPASRLTQAVSVIPSNMAYETEQNLRDIENLYGPIDTFVANELGYHDLDDLNNAFFAEQVDAIAMAIHQLKQGKGMIIGDMTGIGKGRIAAGLIRWAVNQGEVPTFFTENSDLFSDIYRDLYGIGSGHLVPFIVNDPSSDRDANIKKGGRIVYKAGTIKDKRQFFEKGKLPHGTKVVLCTYSQLNSEKQTLKRGFISNHTRDGYMFLDESHNVAGDSKSGKFFQDLLQQAKGAAFFSATYAKRADNMPVYAMKTSMQDAGLTNEALVEAIQSGGNAMQEIIASQLVKSGQMIRRERDFTGVENTFTTMGVGKDGKPDELGIKHRELADQVINVCNAIIDFERTHVLPAMENMEAILRKNGQKISQTKSKGLSVANTPFASKMFNIVNQMLFSIKAPELANEAIRQLKEHGRKPVITFHSTMESFLKNGGYKPGDHVEDVSFSASLMKGLENTLKYRIEHPNGEKEVGRFDLEDLGEDAKNSWNEVVKQIKAASTDMSISPIDTITDILTKAGLSVGEVTGRSMKLVFNEDHSAAEVEGIPSRDTAGIIHDFNNGGGGGKADVLLLNAAGATGFSFHADKSFKDQRQRVMINGQFKLDINKEIQTRGRIDRTNQVKRGKYIYLTTSIPAETRLAMMVSDKLKKLQANTAGDQKDKKNEMQVTDFLNEYGDQVMTDYLAANPAIYDQLFHGADPAGIKDLKPGQSAGAVDGIARKATGRAALLNVKEQEEFYNAVSQDYNDYVDYLNSTNQNTMAVKSVNLEAKVLSKGVFVEGKHTQSPFGQDSMLEKVEANVLGKPLTKEELESAIADVLDGKSPAEAAKALIDGVREFYANALKRSLERYQENYDKRDAKDLRANVGNPELYKAAKAQNDEQMQKNVEYATNENSAAEGKMSSLFRDYRVGSEHMVPTSITGAETKYTKGIFLGFHFKEKHNHNPYTPSNVLMKFAVLDGSRTITVAASRSEFINALYAGKAQLSRSELEQMGKMRENWEETVKNTKAREPRFIVTGNILQAFRPNMGHLISYTTDKGAIEKGILMPKDFNPAQNGKSVVAVAIYDKIMAMHIDGDPIISSDGNVEIHKEASRSFSIRVPKSTKAGGKYFKNEALLAVVNFGEFHTYAGKMEATVESYRVMDMLKVLEKEFNLKFNTGIDLQESMEPQSNDHRTGSKVSKSVPLKPRDSGELKPSEPSEKPSEPSGDEHSFVDAKSTERIQAATYMPVTHDGEPIPLKKLPDMISDLAKGLNVKMYYAASKRKNAAGSYSPSTGGIKLGIVNNLDVTIHEVGHALDDRYLLFDTIPAADNAAIMTELQWFADRGGSNPPAGASAAQKAEYLKREGIAEFTRAWVINRNEALARAPKFFAHFENTIPEDVLDVLHEFGGDYLRYINGTALDNIMANIEEVPKEQRPAYRRFIESVFGKHGEFHLTPFDKLQVRLSNSGHAFNESYKYILNLAGGDIKSTVPGENARDLALLFAGVDGKIGSFFDNGIVNGKNEPIIDGRTGQRMNLEWLLGSFDSTSVESLKQDQALSIAYMVSERTIEKAMQFDRQNDISGISAAGDQTDTDIAIKFLTKEFGRDMPREQKIRIMEGARRYQLWSDKMLRYMVDKGRLSESNYRDIKEKNLAYVAFLPVQENAPGEEMTFDNISNLTKSAAVGNVKNVIKEMTGSTMHKRHPYISLMQNTASMIKEADRNEILQSYIEPMVNTIRAMGDGKVNPFADIMMEVGPVEKSQGKPVISVYLNGHAKFYMFSPEAKDVYDYIRGLTNLPQLPGIATAIPRLLRWTATRSPVFAKNHLIRSTFNRLIISRTGSGLGDFIKGKRDNEDELYALFGGSQNGYWLGNRIDYYKLQNQLIKEMAGKGNTVVINPGEMAKKFYKGYMDLIHQSDVVNRTAEFRSAYKKAITPKHQGGLGFDEYNANLYAAMQSKDLLNASVAGTWMRVFNQFIPFSNVEIQGLKRNIKAAIESGDLRGLGLWAIRMVLYILLPTLFTRLLAHIGGYEEEYDNLPAYQRDLGWNFKVPGQESWFYAPKPYDSGLLGAGMDRMIGGFGKNNENAWYGFDKTVFQSLFLMKPEMAVGPLADVVEPMTNYSFFKQGPIVPRYEEDKLLALRHNFNTASRLGKGISVLSSPFFKQGDAIDPRYVDEIMQTTFSYYGDWAMSLSDIGSKESRHKFGWRTTGFIKEQQIAGDARVEKLYGVAKELGLTSSRPIKALSGLIREYYDATQPSDRKSLHEQIMGLAKDTYKSWMADDIYKEKIESKGKEINFN